MALTDIPTWMKNMFNVTSLNDKPTTTKKKSLPAPSKVVDTPIVPVGTTEIPSPSSSKFSSIPTSGELNGNTQIPRIETSGIMKKYNDSLMAVSREDNALKDIPSYSKGPDKTLLDLYTDDYVKQVDSMSKNANLIDGAKGLANISSLMSAINLNDPTDLVAPVISAPKYMSASQYLTEEAKKNIDKQVNTANRISAETGNPESIVATTANAIDANADIATKGVLADIEVINKQAEADANANNQNALTATEIKNKNIERRLQYNILKGQSISDSLNALGQQGTDFVNRLGSENYAKFVARMSAEEAKIKEAMMINQSL